MHDLVFAEQTKWQSQKDVRPAVIAYAKSLGLDAVKFEKDFDSDEVKDRVNRDFKEANRVGMPGTPTMFLNGKQIANSRNFDEFKAVIEKAINENL
jgi:protein-disulfide isomerase